MGDMDRAASLLESDPNFKAVSADTLRSYNKNKKIVKKLAKSHDIFIASDSLMKTIPRLLGPTLHKAGKFPTPLLPTDDIATKVNEVKATIKFQLKKVLCLAVAVGHVNLKNDELIAHKICSQLSSALVEKELAKC